MGPVGFAQRNERTNGSLLAFQDAQEVVHVAYPGVAALHLHEHLLGLVAHVVEKVDVIIDAGVRALLVILGGLCVGEVHRRTTRTGAG